MGNTNLSSYILIYLHKPVNEEFLRDVILAIRVFKSQIKLIVSVQQLETLIRLGPWTSLAPTRSIDVYLNVFLQLFGIVKTAVPRAAVGYEPGDGLGLVGRVVFWLFFGNDVVVVVLPSLVRGHDGRVAPVR